MATKKSETDEPPKIGRPRAARAGRYYLRHHREEFEAWRIAALTCGMTTPEWMIAVLNGEAAKPRHVEIVKRKVS